MKLSRRAAVLKTALATYLWPKLARNDTRVYLDACVADVTAGNYASKTGDVIQRVTAACRGKLLAADQALDDLPNLVESLPGLDPDDDDDVTEVDDRPGEFLDGIDQEPGERLLTWLKQNLHPDRVAEYMDLAEAGRPRWLQENLTQNQLAEYRELFGSPDDDETESDHAGPPDFPGKPRTGAMDSFYERYPSAQLIGGDVIPPVRRKPASARVAMDAATKRESDREAAEARWPDAQRIG